MLRTVPDGSSWKVEEQAEDKSAKVTEISYESEDEGGPQTGFGQVMSRGDSKNVERGEYTTNNDDMDIYNNNNMDLGKTQEKQYSSGGQWQ